MRLLVLALLPSDLAASCGLLGLSMGEFSVSLVDVVHNLIGRDHPVLDKAGAGDG